MLLALHRAALTLACIAWLGHAGQAEELIQKARHSHAADRQKSWEAFVRANISRKGANAKGTGNPLKMLVMVLLSVDSEAAFHPSRVVDTTPAIKLGLRFQSSGSSAAQMSDASASAATVLTAKSCLPNTSPAEAYSILSSTGKWPEVFLSSVRVNIDGTALDQGMKVEELAGLPPLLPLQLVWECKTADADRGTLELASEGVDGLVKDYTRRLTVSSDAGSGSVVELETEFTAGSSLFAAIIALLIRSDHALFDSVLLPSAVEQGGLSRKSLLVWSILIGAWAISSFGWMRATGADMAFGS